jgi:hypothetical protein
MARRKRRELIGRILTMSENEDGLNPLSRCCCCCCRFSCCCCCQPLLETLLLSLVKTLLFTTHSARRFLLLYMTIVICDAQTDKKISSSFSDKIATRGVHSRMYVSRVPGNHAIFTIPALHFFLGSILTICFSKYAIPKLPAQPSDNKTKAKNKR